MAVIPFYGATDHETFAIERRTMDRAGRVLDVLDRRLPAAGTVLDVGAGDGFTATRIDRARRRVVAMEPAAGMIRPDRAVKWVGGDAEALPFATGACDDLDEARRLLGFFFGDRGRAGARRRLGYRVGVFHAASRGPGDH